MPNILTPGNNRDYCLIDPNLTKINEYISRAKSEGVFWNRSYWDDLLNYLKIEENGIDASELSNIGCGSDIEVYASEYNYTKDIPFLAGHFFRDAESLMRTRDADFVSVQDLGLKDFNSFLKSPVFYGKALVLKRNNH